MSTLTSLRAQVTDANHRPRGMMNIEFDGDSHGPYRVIHEGQSHPGQHQAIITKAQWDAAHALIASNP